MICVKVGNFININNYKLLFLFQVSTNFHASCDDARTEPGHPDRILYNKVPKCGSTTLELIFEKVGNLTGMNVVLQYFVHGHVLDTEQQVKCFYVCILVWSMCLCRWEDAKGAYLKFINILIMGHIEIFSYTNTHIHPITHNHSL